MTLSGVASAVAPNDIGLSLPLLQDLADGVYSYGLIGQQLGLAVLQERLRARSARRRQFLVRADEQRSAEERREGYRRYRCCRK